VSSGGYGILIVYSVYFRWGIGWLWVLFLLLLLLLCGVSGIFFSLHLLFLFSSCFLDNGILMKLDTAASTLEISVHS
jgi:hypothetical protein